MDPRNATAIPAALAIVRESPKHRLALGFSSSAALLAAPAHRLLCVTPKMMRVTRIEKDGAPATLLVEGRLTDQTQEELRMACEAVFSEHGALRLELSGLQFVDRAGVALLRSL